MEKIVLIIFILLFSIPAVVCSVAFIFFPVKKVSFFFMRKETREFWTDSLRSSRENPLEDIVRTYVFFGWWVIFYGGLAPFFYFLPTEWGFLDVDNDWITPAKVISGALALPLALVIIGKLGKLHSLEQEK